MPLFSHRRRQPVATTTTTASRGGIFHRYRRGRRAPVVSTTHHTHNHMHHVQHQHRHATLGDKISGAFLKLKGTLTGRLGQKAAGTRRMHGTDGRGSVRRRRFF